MGLNTVIKRISLDIMQVAIRPAEIYLLADYNPGSLFTIVGGPVWIKGLFAQATVAAETTAATAAITVNGVAIQNAALNVDSALGDIIMWPLDAAGGAVIVPNVAINPMPTLAAALLGNSGTVSGPGDIALTVSADMDSTFVFYVVYYRMSPNSQIVVA